MADLLDTLIDFGSDLIGGALTQASSRFGGMRGYAEFPGEPGDLAGADLSWGDPATRTFFSQGTGSYRPQAFSAVDPTGKRHFFGPMGRPMLWSRDFAAAKRLDRIARKASRGRSRGGYRRRRGGR